MSRALIGFHAPLVRIELETGKEKMKVVTMRIAERRREYIAR